MSYITFTIKNRLCIVVNFSQYSTAVDGVYSNNEDTLKNHLKLFTKELINLKH